MLRGIANTYKAAFAGLPRDVWLLGVVMLVNRAGSMVLPFIALYLTTERGFSVLAAGRLLGLYGVGSFVGAWIGGWASDRIGPGRSLTVSLAGSGIVFVWFAFQREVWTITAGVFLLSVVSESFRPVCMAAMAERAPARLRVRAFALLRLAANLGVGIGPAVGGVLALWDYRSLFIVDAVTCWLAAWLVLRLPPPPVAADSGQPESAAAAATPMRDGPFMLLLLFVILLALAFFQVFSTLPLYWRQIYGLREDAIGMLLALNAAFIALFEMVLIHKVERYDRMRLIGLGAVLVCLGFGLMPLGNSIPWAAFTIVVWTVGEMLALPLLNAVVADRAATAHRGRYMGLYTMAYSVAFAIAPAAGAWVYEGYGPDVLWYAIGALSLPLALGAWVLRGALREAPAAESRKSR